MKGFLLKTVAASLLLAVPFYAQAQRKPAAAAPASEAEYKQLANVKELSGTLTSVSGKTLALTVEFQQVVLDPSKVGKVPNVQMPKIQPNFNMRSSQGNFNRQRQMQNLMRRQAEIARARTPQERQRRMQSFMQEMQRLQMQMMQEQARQQQQMAQQMQQQLQKAGQNNMGPYKIETTSRLFEFTMRDDTVVRRMNLPFTYDDKGNVKEYTPAEIQKAKGNNPNLPGYEAKLEDLQNGATVQLYIGPPKEGQIGGVDLVGNIIRPDVRAVVILEDLSGLTGIGR